MEDKKPDHIIKGEKLAEKLTSNDVYEIAINFIKGDVEGGDSIGSIKAGRKGQTAGEFIGFASIGSLGEIKGKNYGSDFICIKLDDDREFTYKLKNIYDEIKHKQTTLF